jgi:ubiquinone/menaquinone biosynthesis C-methylase UbiE
MSGAKPPLALEQLRQDYAAGRNLMELMRRARASDQNDETTILYSYDLQAGSYVAELANPASADLRRRVGEKFASLFATLGASVVCEAGVGEATTLAEVVSSSPRSTHFLGFDLSLSRLLYARKHLSGFGHNDVELFAGALGALPFPDDSVDLLYTCHSIEPNGGQERAVLEELLRVTQHHLVLVEPSNELGGAATRAHIEKHGYVKNLKATLDAMGCKVTRHEPWGLDSEPDHNQAALLIVEKRHRETGATVRKPSFVSPVSKRPLTVRPDCYYSAEDGFAFPVIGGIPCLVYTNAIVATHLADFDTRR